MNGWERFLSMLLPTALFVAFSYVVWHGKVTGVFKRPALVLVNTIWVIGVVSFLGVMAMGMYQSADKDGWFPHDLAATVRMPHDWLVGEFKLCVLDGSESTPVLECGSDENSSLHKMDVKFRGSMRLFESNKVSHWNCQRKEESISCKN